MSEIAQLISQVFTGIVVPWLQTSGLRIALVIIGSLIIIRLIFAAISRMELLVEDDDPNHLSEREKRVRTLGSILRKLTVAIIGAVVIFTILPTKYISGLLAAAGIGGLAIGFGAQNLVRDIISGFFLLFENQVRVGDVITINGSVSGQVEDITLRTIILRDLEGTVHIFPNGTIQYISNKTKSWSRAVLDIGVAYKEDVNHVMNVLREIGEELAADESFRPLILEPLQVLGVNDFRDSQVTIRTMITTLPLKQWDVARELRRRIKIRFDQEGIEIPFPHLSLYWGEASKPIPLASATGLGEQGATSEKQNK